MDYTQNSYIEPDKKKQSEQLENLDYNMEYVDPPEAKVPFANYYNEQILPFIKEEEAKIEAQKNSIALEEEKLKAEFKIAKYKTLKRILISIFAALVYVYFASHYLGTASNNDIDILSITAVIFLCPIFFFTLLVWATNPTKEIDGKKKRGEVIKNKIKEKIMLILLHQKVISKALRFCLPDIQELERSPITGKELKSFCALDPNWSFEEQEYTCNYKKGNYKDAFFELYQHIEEFDGEIDCEHLFIILNIDTNFKGTAIIVDRKFNVENWVGEDFKHLPKIKLEGEYFDDKKPDSQKFDVYSSDQVEVKNLLHSSFMDAILKLDDLFDQRLSQVSYHKNQVVFIIEKFGSDHKVEDSYKNYVKDIQRLFKQMDIIFEIIDTLKLNEQTKV